MHEVQLYDAIKSIWKPPANYLFPKSSMFNYQRSFQHKWLDTYKWLAYSKDEDGAYCRPCIFFGTHDQQKSGKNLERLLSEPLKNWNVAGNKFIEHEMLADEAQDASNKEQMALIIRYVNVDGVIQEDFLRFVHCADGKTGENIANNIKKTNIRNMLDDLGDLRMFSNSPKRQELLTATIHEVCQENNAF
ncbi:PREDICTED: uncharacterized protein LOC106816115 [Priapulus caudatus]|uniref:Uncharacterized protein LOC106816115 n=1 Tax=Priapulus caudatus TaxID=37621 RepID=A0ABM1EVD3_PRICU|nr:PREDICTED: uncharacterized protein LOC106816115 [Priapulus caudatus]